MTHTAHAINRAKQRGLPPFIDQLLDAYGHEEYNGHGQVIVFLDKKSRRSIAQDLGAQVCTKLDCWLDSYKVTDSRDGTTITIGHRFLRIKRK